MKKLIFCLLLVIPMRIFGQVDGISDQSAPNQHFWLKVGLGSYDSRRDPGISLYSSLTYQRNDMIKLRFMLNEEFSLFDFDEKFYDIGLMYGKSKTFEWTKISAYAGIGVFAGILQGDYIGPGSGGWFSPNEYEKKKFTTYGIPLELEFSILPKQLLGIGISLYSNVNKVNSLYGVALKLEIGR